MNRGDARCEQCWRPLRLCECGNRCMNGHLHKSETDAVMCELRGPTNDGVVRMPEVGEVKS